MSDQIFNVLSDRSLQYPEIRTPTVSLTGMQPLIRNQNRFNQYENSYPDQEKIDHWTNLAEVSASSFLIFFFLTKRFPAAV